MSVADYCLIAAAGLPYVWVGAAKFRPGYNNHAPRAFLEKSEGWRRRANWAQMNAWEAFAPFAAAVLLAELRVVEQARVDQLAVVFIVARVLHGLAYIADQAPIRSLVWSVGLGAVLWLFLLGAGAPIG